LFLLWIIAVRHGADYDALSGKFLWIFNLRPVLYIKKRTPFLRVPGKALHKRRIAIFTGMGTPHIWIDRITAHRQAGFGHDIFCFYFSNENILFFLHFFHRKSMGIV